MTFGLVKHNNNSISAITTPGSLAQGKMTLLQTQTASSSASISFTSNIDSTYPIYVFKFINIHSSADASFTFQADTGTNTNYNQTITSTAFNAYHYENDGATALTYNANKDLAQSSNFQRIGTLNSENDDSCNGILQIFQPSDTIFVKHFLCVMNSSAVTPATYNDFVGGYFNTTNALTRFQFKMSTGNIDSGTIKLYGIKGS
jgi:hypothetical protein